MAEEEERSHSQQLSPGGSGWIPGGILETRGNDDDDNDDDDDDYDNDDDDDDGDVEIRLDIILTRLWTKEGLDLGWIKRIQEEGGTKFDDLLEKVLRGTKLDLDLGFLKVKQDRGMSINEGSEFLYLTDPDGFLFSNTVISSIFAEII